MSEPSIVIERDPALIEARIGAVVARGVVAGPSSEALARELDLAVAHAARTAADRTEDPDGDARRAVRDLLRHGAYKPTGRGKPASEYLLGAAQQGTFPRVGNLVDINNLVSLESLLPASILDVERAGTRRFRVRRGRPGESYVFNSAGQSIELRDLLLVACLPEDRPTANPVKDSMATKVGEATREVLVVLYAPVGLLARLEAAAARCARLLVEHAGAPEVQTLGVI
jgi:DNA/RNA-binding domain of Phe-tRNA-synthetase-like protein